MKKLIFTLIICCAITPAFAALSPLNQSIREIEAILSSRELAQYFPQNDTILEIKYEKENYLIRTESSQVTVEVIPIPTHRIGPKEFKLIFQK